MKIKLIYLAAGNSRRFNSQRMQNTEPPQSEAENKLLYLLDEKPMFRYLFDRLVKVCQRHPEWEMIVVTQYPEIEHQVKALQENEQQGERFPVKKFLEETYGILSEAGSFFQRVNIHIIQCDDQVQSDRKITCKEELQEYMEKLDLVGEGGTDFRPAFAYIDELIATHRFTELKGVIYFTDGQGIYPQKMPPYQTAFVFMDDGAEEQEVPPWAMKLVLDEEDLRGVRNR